MSHPTPTADQIIETAAIDPLRAAAEQIRNGGAGAFGAMVKRNQVLTIACASTFLLFVAGLGPQLNATEAVSVMSVNVGAVTAHSIIPGWVYLLLALGAGVGLVQFGRTAIPEWLMVTRLAAGLSSLAVVIAILQSALDSQVGIGATGWGYYLALISTFVLTFVTRVLFSRAKRTAK
jgi:hypothetical protein